MKIYNLFWCLCILLIGITSCKKDDTVPDGPPPSTDGIVLEIPAQQGEEIVFSGTVTDELGLKSITITYLDWYLDKTIELTSEPLSYELNYKFLVPEDATPGSHYVTITALNTSEKEVPVEVTVNVANPVPLGSFASPVDGMKGDEVALTGSITDKVGLDNVTISYSAWSLNETIDLSSNPKEYSLVYSLTIPEDATLEEHTVTISVTNILNETVNFPVVVNVTDDPVSYQNIWVAGGVQWHSWDPSKAYKMLQDPADEDWFEILIHAWSGGGDEIKFLGQLGWNPNNWGLVDNTDPSQGMINSDASEVIILGADDSSIPEYFKIRFNPYALSYTTEEVTITEPVQSEMYIVGNGFPGYPDLNWNTEEAIPMTANPDGKGANIFLIEHLEFSDDVSLKFIGQNTGWSPIDVGFDDTYLVDEDPDAGGMQVTAPISWQPTKSGSGTSDLKFVGQAGFYTVLYDHNAKRAIIWKE